MEANYSMSTLLNWIFGTLVLTIGVLNLFLVHPVPGITYLLLSLLYFSPAHLIFKRWFGFSIPILVKIILGLVIILFTFGVSDLGDMIDKL
ncbi:hypothetical protein [Rufibacter tibetensis]|uniref:Uncharacterized protein n=1 Tax=Rufibacter tibetensis TaxID=512763 RepID=A0A0P0C6M5_9BACT|nr:hypothetical protein [Rufibacter tibetensis]ALJ00916.1 hypothetical protein DC20_20385 [Rufibacter tibetensis]